MNFKVILGAIIVILVAFFIVSSPSDTSNNVTETESQELKTESSDDRLLTNPTESKATLIEYSDFECPACASIYPILDQAKKDFGDRVTIVFRHFPLTSIHPNAMSAHRIAEASNNQGVFSEVHDLLFQQNQSWSTSNNPKDAIYSLIETSNINIDMNQLKSDTDDSATLRTINNQIKTGRDLGVNATPTFFLDGDQIQFVSYEELATILENAVSEPDQEQQ